MTNNKIVDAHYGKMIKELDRMIAKINRFDDFLESNKYAQCAKDHKRLIQLQYHSLVDYTDALAARILYEDNLYVAEESLVPEEEQQQCCDCMHFNEEQHKCDHNNGLLHSIHISDSMAEATHNCVSHEEKRVTITPKECFFASLMECGLDDTQISAAWSAFKLLMQHNENR